MGATAICNHNPELGFSENVFGKFCDKNTYLDL